MYENMNVGGIAGSEIGNGLGQVTVREAEIPNENRRLEKSIQSAFEMTRTLEQRLMSVMQQVPNCPREAEMKEPESVSSDLGSTLRAHRKAVEGINETLTDILNRLAI